MSEYKVRGFFTAPTALRAIRKEDPNLDLLKKYDVSGLRGFYLAGERCDPATAEAFAKALGMPVTDNWWQTETGWPICGFQDDAIGMRPGSTSLPFPGYNLEVLDDQGKALSRGSVGTLAIKLPLPPSCFPTLWNNDQGYVENTCRSFQATTRPAMLASSIRRDTLQSWSAQTMSLTSLRIDSPQALSKQW